MSLVAKVFIVINQILALVLIFLLGTLLVHKADYKKLASLKTRAKEAKVKERARREADYAIQVEGLSERIREKTREHNEIVQEIDQIKDELKEREIEEGRLKREIAQLEDQLRVVNKVNSDSQQRKRALETALRTAREKLSTAKGHERDWIGKLQEQESQVRRLKAQLNNPR